MKFPLAVVCSVFALAYLTAVAKGDVVTEWNAVTLEAFRNESTAPPLAARNLAIRHIPRPHRAMGQKNVKSDQSEDSQFRLV